MSRTLSHSPLGRLSQHRRGSPARQGLRLFLGLVALLLALGAAAPARAAIVISTDTTIDYAIYEPIEVTGSAVVTIVADGYVGGYVAAHDTSTVTISGG